MTAGHTTTETTTTTTTTTTEGGQMTITLERWELASIDERQKYLTDGTELDGVSGQVLGWAIAFRDVGASISGEQMLRVWERQRDKWA